MYIENNEFHLKPKLVTKINKRRNKRCYKRASKKIHTTRVGLALSAELEQQLENSCGVLSPSPLSTLLPINILLLRV